MLIFVFWKTIGGCMINKHHGLRRIWQLQSHSYRNILIRKLLLLYINFKHVDSFCEKWKIHLELASGNLLNYIWQEHKRKLQNTTNYYQVKVIADWVQDCGGYSVAHKIQFLIASPSKFIKSDSLLNNHHNKPHSL